MKHIKPAFSIQAPKIDFDTAQLIVEAGPQGFSLLVTDNGNNLKALVVYNFRLGRQQHELTNALTGIFKGEHLLQKKYSKTHIFWSFNESILVPAKLFETEKQQDMIGLVYGDAPTGDVRSDFLYKHNLHNVYRVPKEVVETFSSYLPVATQTHLFSVLANKDLEPGDHVYSVLYHNSITIVLSRQGELQAVQRFEFNTPHDCVFHLLNTCRTFDVNTQTVNLHISGMIDVQSELYAAIHKYFLQIEFADMPEEINYHESVRNYPQHYFSHLVNLALCV